jgi:hypothetical protein
MSCSNRCTFLSLLIVASFFVACSSNTGSGAKSDATGADTGVPVACTDAQCDIDGACYENGAINAVATCQMCSVADNRTAWSPINSGACDDGSACTENDACAAGGCTGTQRTCTDDNACTTDSCDAATGCVFTAEDGGACDDNSACTENDVCQGGQCAGSQLSCNDNNGCTDDSCDPTQGCVNAPNAGGCNDKDPCTLNDICSGGECTGTAINCDDGNDCTTDKCNDEGQCVNTKQVTNECLPMFDILSPARGATVKTPDPELTVLGKVNSAGGDITSMTINSKAVTLDSNGNFSHDITANIGLNVLTMVATDALGGTRKRVQSFMWSTFYRKPTNKSAKNGIVPGAAAVYIDKNVIDDGTRNYDSPKNLGTLAQMVLEDIDIGAFIPSPASTQDAGVLGKYNIYITNLKHNTPTVSLTTMTDKIRIYAEIKNITADFKAKRSCSYNLFSCNGPSEITGDVTVSEVGMQADVVLSVKSYALKATVENVAVSLAEDDITIDVDGFFGFLTEFILDFFKDDMADQLKSTFKSTVEAQVGPMLQDSLNSFSLAQSFDVPSLSDDGSTFKVDLYSDFNAVSTTSKGISMFLRGAGYANKVTTYETSLHKGAPARAGCTGGSQSISITKDSPLAASIADDLINSVLYAGWRGGLLEFVIPNYMMDEKQLEDNGITNLKLNASGMLAPLANDCNPTNTLYLQVGDLRIDANMKLLNLDVKLQVWTSFDIELEIEALPDACQDWSAAAKGCAETPACESAVCAKDDYCCSVEWDSFCAACAAGGETYDGTDCASTAPVCAGGISLALGDFGDLNIELSTLDDALIPVLPIFETQIQTMLLPQIAYYLAKHGLVKLALPKIDIGGLVAGIPEGTMIGINPTSSTRKDGYIIIKGTVK